VVLPLVEKNKAKYSNDPEKKNQELIKLLSANRYPFFGGLGNLIVELIFAIPLIGIFRKPEIFLEYSTVENMRFLFVDLSKTPFSYLNSFRIDYLPSLLIVLFAIGLIIIHDILMDKVSFINQTNFNKICWGLFTASFLFFNYSFTLYWIGMKVFDLTHMGIVKYFSQNVAMAKRAM
jgi:hypothetical protein